MKKIFVTSAAGQTGVQVMKCLSQHKGDIELCGGILPEKKEEHEKRVAEYQVKCCAVDAHDRNALAECFRGIDDLFIIPSSEADKVTQGKNYIRAAKEANVKFVLLLSMIKADEKSYLFGEQNLLLYKDQLKQGVLPLPTRQGKFAPVDVEDVAMAASFILKDCKKHVGKVYTLTGPESLDGQSMATHLSKALNKQFKFEDIEIRDAKKILREQNVPGHEIQGLLEFYEVVRDNEMDLVSKDFQNICGQNPTTLFEFCKKHASLMS